MPTAKVKSTPERATVLTKAVLRTADLLGLKDAELAQVIGVSSPTVSRYKQGSAELNPEHKAGELGILLIRLFASLDALVGSDDGNRKAWMHGQCKPLGAVPAMLIRRPGGLVRTLAYLDGMRVNG